MGGPISFARGMLAAMLLIPAVSSAAVTSTFDPEKWQIKLTPLLWIAGLTGDAETRFGGASTSSDFDDVVASLEFGFMGHAEIGKGKWAILFDGIYLDVGAEGSGPLGGDVDCDVRFSLADVGLAYQFFDVPLAGVEREPRMLIDGMAGVRYIGLRVELDPELLRSRSRNADLFDPYVGGRVTFVLNDKWTILGKATIGGFGVGADLDWTAGVFVDYRVASWFSLMAGYYLQHLDIEDGGRRNGLDFEATFHGPVVGMTFHF